MSSAPADFVNGVAAPSSPLNRADEVKEVCNAVFLIHLLVVVFSIAFSYVSKIP